MALSVTRSTTIKAGPNDTAKRKINASKESDFLVSDKYTLEVGGKNKQKKQIESINNAFIVKDDIEIGSDNTIPIWLFGFLY